MLYLIITPFFPTKSSFAGSYLLDQAKEIKKQIDNKLIQAADRNTERKANLLIDPPIFLNKRESIRSRHVARLAYEQGIHQIHRFYHFFCLFGTQNK